MSIKDFSTILINNKNSSGQVISDNWNTFTIPSWFDSIFEGIRRPNAILSLGPGAIVKSVREIPTILLMDWAFKKGLMEFGVYKCLSLIHISEPTRLGMISYAVFCLKK